MRESREKREPDPAAAGEVSRQLGRDAEELALTRVGFAGQALKKRLLDQYARLKDQQFPDRLIGIHKGLAESLDELAALMADIADLTATYERSLPAAPPTDADAFLPSKPHAEALRELTRQQRALHDRITGLSATVQQRVKPTENNPLAALEQQERELTAAITLFVQKLEVDAAKLSLEVATEANRAADGLVNGLVGPVARSAEQAAQALRQLSESNKSKPWAMTAADLAARQDALIAELTKVPDAPCVAASQQKARGEELARKAGELARQLKLAARNSGPDESASKVLLDAAATAKTAGELIAEATLKAANGIAADAEKVRAAAAGSLKACAKKVGVLVPMMTVASTTDPAATNAAVALRRAEMAMRQALDELDAKTDRAAIEKAMRTAADTLDAATKARAEMMPERK